MVQSIAFQRVSLAIILANSAIIAIADYSRVDVNNNLVTSGSIRNQVFIGSDVYFSSFFIIECILKMFALGVIGDRPTYFSDSWNWLDFVVVIAGYGESLKLFMNSPPF